MIRTPFCDRFRLDAPIVQASIGPWTSVDLTAAVSEAGGLGSLGTTLRSADELRRDIAALRERTDRPFAVNHTTRPLDEEVLAVTLAARPPVISLALATSREIVERAHEVGALFVQQVHTVAQARRAAELGVDAIIAQGTEAGGFSGTVGTFALVPQVVDAVSPLPVIAAGGIADGRGVAAALVLGAQGVNVGTRFLASVEATISDEWKRAIVEARSEDAVKAEFADDVFPPPSGEGFVTRPRVLRTPFVDEWNRRLTEVPAESARLQEEIVGAVRAGRGHEYVPFTGESAGLIHEILPAGEIVRRLVAEAEEALRRATDASREGAPAG